MPSIQHHLVYCELINAARYRGTTTYQRVARIGGLPEAGAAMANQVGALLGQICRLEMEAGRPMLSVVCVGVQTHVPGPGFYVLARELGRLEGVTPAEEEAFFRAELEDVYEAWAHP